MHFNKQECIQMYPDHARCSHCNILQPDVYETNAKHMFLPSLIYVFLGFHHFSYQIRLPDPGFWILATRSWLPDPNFQILAARS